MNDPLSYRVFLSSTFSDLGDERSAVQHVIQRMGDRFVGMEYFGSAPSTPLGICLEELRACDIMVLVLGYRYGSVPPDSESSMVEHEYEEALCKNIPVLAYVADREAYHPEETVDGERIDATGERPVEPRLLAFRTRLREAHQAPCFRSPEDLAIQVAVDLSREIRKTNSRYELDTQGVLASRHTVVTDCIEDGELEAARSANEEILADSRCSPRAHYNQACVCSLLAEVGAGASEREALLKEARSHLRLAARYGIFNVFRFYAGRTLDNIEIGLRVVQDPDLKILFEQWPSLRAEIRGQLPAENVGCGC